MLEWTDYPVAALAPPTVEEMAAMEPEILMAIHAAREEAVTNALKDPYRYGYIPSHWEQVDQHLAENDEALLLGGQRSGKTEYSARSVVKAAVMNPGSRIFCFAQNARTSVEQQQCAVWKWLPAEYRRKIMGTVANVNFSFKNGFTDGSFILPNESRISFLTYSQFQQDDTMVEGAELGSRKPGWINIGSWLDEMLGGPALLKTMRNRHATRDAKMLVTFTPLKGWTEVIRSYLDGAETLETRAAELLQNRLLPIVQRCRERKATVHYFHSILNPFNNYERLARNLAGAPEREVLIKAYGVPTKSHTAAFPKFSRTANVCTPEMVPTKNVTRYQVIDPAGRKNWFMCWIAVNAEGEHWIYREWPDMSVGQWAEPADGEEWKPGDGAKGLGYGYRDYIELIESLETGEDGKREEIYMRLIDPRLGAQRYQKEDSDSCIIEDLDELDFVVIPAPGGEIEDGIQDLQNLLAYDDTRPIDGTNQPRLKISEECENTILAFENYTGSGGKNESWKDPIDCPRYAVAYGIDHVDPALAGGSGKRTAGY